MIPLKLGLFRRKPDSRGGMSSRGLDKAGDVNNHNRSALDDLTTPSGVVDRIGGVQDGGRAAGAAGTGVAGSGTSETETNASPGPLLQTHKTLSSVAGVRSLPRPALRWVGAAGRIAIREFDFDADSEAVCSFQEDTYSLNFPDFRYTNSFAAAFRHDLRRASLDPQHALFVLDEGEIVGFLWLVICQNTWTGERYGYVNNLYITANRRDQGLGGELMQQADAFFKSRRIKRVRLTVTASNAAAARLYEGCGYSTTRWEMEKEL